MDLKTKPIIVVSECLGFSACRYDGGRSESRLVQELSPFVEFITVCPEVAIGLGTPRPPIWMVEQNGQQRLIQPETDRDLTEKMEQFAEKFLNDLSLVDGFILKSRSPSCGINDCKLLDSPDNTEAPIGKTRGCFAACVQDKFKDLPIESEASLKDDEIRQRFLQKVFARAIERM